MHEWPPENTVQAFNQGWLLINVGNSGLHEIQRLEVSGCRFKSDGGAWIYVKSRADTGDSVAWLAICLHERDREALKEWRHK
jgi:hypothetical protein